MKRFFVYGLPQGQGRITSFVNPKTNKVVSKHSNADRLKPWRNSVNRVAQDYAYLHPHAVRLDLVFFMQRPKSAPKRWVPHTKRPDLSHLTRAVEDALSGVMYLDDSQITHETVTKVYAMDCPVGVLVTVSAWSWEQEVSVVIPARQAMPA